MVCLRDFILDIDTDLPDLKSRFAECAESVLATMSPIYGSIRLETASQQEGDVYYPSKEEIMVIFTLLAQANSLLPGVTDSTRRRTAHEITEWYWRTKRLTRSEPQSLWQRLTGKR